MTGYVWYSRTRTVGYCKMPRSFLVKKHIPHKKPNYGMLDSKEQGMIIYLNQATVLLLLTFSLTFHQYWTACKQHSALRINKNCLLNCLFSGTWTASSLTRNAEDAMSTFLIFRFVKSDSLSEQVIREVFKTENKLFPSDTEALLELSRCKISRTKGTDCCWSLFCGCEGSY